jgi:hypothetical protein
VSSINNKESERCQVNVVQGDGSPGGPGRTSKDKSSKRIVVDDPGIFMFTTSLNQMVGKHTD